MAIVNLAYRPKFKYNIDDIMNTNPEEMKRIHLETSEALMKEFNISSDPKAFFEDLQKPGDAENYIDQNKADRFSTLLDERFSGKYKDDLDGFVEELRVIKNSMSVGEPSTLPNALQGVNPFTQEGVRTFEEIVF